MRRRLACPASSAAGCAAARFDLDAAELLFQLLATRYENMSTIITSNLGFSDWVKVFHDKTLTTAILDRITHHALILNMNGKSFRRK
jgi:DNA replication protein DnaC